MAKNDEFDLFAITPEMERYASLCEEHSTIDTSLYEKYDVKRGLRDINGKGVLTGLTEISDIQSSNEFRTRYHHEGSHKGHDEYAGPQCSDAVCIR